MTFSVKVSKTDTPDLFNAFVKMIDDIHARHRTHGRMEIARAIAEEFKIVVHEYNDGGHKVEFPSERDYLMFILRWS